MLSSDLLLTKMHRASEFGIKSAQFVKSFFNLVFAYSFTFPYLNQITFREKHTQKVIGVTVLSIFLK